MRPGYCRVRTTAELVEELETIGCSGDTGEASALGGVTRDESPDPSG